jgi:hypothetical protein
MHTFPTRPSRLRLLAALTLLALVLLALAGCGGSSSSSKSSSSGGSDNGIASKSPDQILAAAKTAADGAATVHVVGSIVSEKKPISLNMELVAGKGAKGHLSVEGLGIDVVEVENNFYLKGSAAFYKHIGGDAAAQLLQGKWLKAPTTGGEFAQLAELTNLGKLLDSTLEAHGTLTHAGNATITGQPAVGITDSARQGTLFVASTGTPYPLQIRKSGSGPGLVNFNRWNEPVTLTPPPNAINLNQLQSGH